MKLETDVFRVVKTSETLDGTIKNCMKTYQELLLEEVESSDETMRSHGEWRLRINMYVDEFAESFLPRKFKGKRYSRLKAIYGWPSIPPRFTNLPLFPNQNNSEFVMMKLKTDPTQTLVLSMLNMDELYFDYSFHYQRGDILSILETYWKSALTLKEFLETYHQEKRKIGTLPWEKPSSFYVWKNNDDKDFWIPEVIIPEWEKERIRIE